MSVFKQILEQISKATNIVITSHKGPDGDSIGCSLSLYHFIKALGHRAVTICHPDPAPHFLTWLDGAEDIVDFETSPEKFTFLMQEADLLFCLDYNSAGRMGEEIESLLRSVRATKIMIDHHLHPEDFCDIMVSEPEACSTSQLIYELIDQSGNLDRLNERIGEPIYLGIMTDTGSFRYSSVTSRTHQIIARLLDQGVNHAAIHERVFDTNTLERLQLRSFVLANNLELLADMPVAILYVTEEQLNRFNYQKGDTEGLVNVALSIDGVQVAAFFAEKEGKVKISFRAKGAFAVNELAAAHFQGGGHKYASGGMSLEPISQTVQRFKSLASNYFKA